MNFNLTKKFVLIFSLVLVACGAEKDAKLATPNTFIRFYNGGYKDIAKLVRQTSDFGFIILSNGGDGNPYGCKIIKTDVYGNQQWQKTFFTNTNPKAITDDQGMDLLVLENGYLLLGAKNIVQLDANGSTIKASDPTKTTSYPNNTIYGTVQGASIIVNNTTEKNYLMSGIISTNLNGSTNGTTMFLAEVNKDTFDWMWFNNVGNGSDGVNEITGKLFLDSKNSAFWSGTVSKSNTQRVRLVSVPQKSSLVNSDNTIGTPGTNQTSNDLIKYGNGFAIIGETSERGDNDVYYYLRTETGTPLGDSRVIDINEPDESKKVTTTPGGGQVIFKLASSDDKGNSIASTLDGGLVLLGTVESKSITGYSKTTNLREFMLVKVDGFGNLQAGWPKYYGSKSDDIGASIIQAADGSIVVLGTTTLAGTESITLMKVDKDGGIL